MLRGEKASIVGITKVHKILDKAEIRDALFQLLSQISGNCQWHVPPKARIMVKINLCMVKGYETGTTVDPFVAKCLVEWLVREFSPRIIYLGEADATQLNADIAFKALGWEDEFRNLPAVEIVNLSKDDLVKVKIEKGLFFKELALSKKYMEADLLISLGKLKTNVMTGITCILKNQFGITSEKYKAKYHSHLSEAIHDLNLVKKPDLCLVDGIIAMEGAGPVDGIPKPAGLIIAANDPVAIDHACAKIMQIPIRTIPPLRLAIKKRLGSTNYKVIGQQIHEVKSKFTPASSGLNLVRSGYAILSKIAHAISSTSQRSSESKTKLKLGIVGLGAVSELIHLPVLSMLNNYCEIVAACEKDPLRRHRRKEEWRIPVIYESYNEMFEKSRLDAVFICLPPFLHYEVVKSALEHNLHVFCEKPLGLNAAKAYELTLLATKLHRVLAVGYSRMLYDGFQKVRNMIKGQELGKILQVHGVLLNPGPYAGWIPRSDWFFNESGGGVLYDSGSHLFSILKHILDDNIREVASTSTTTYCLPELCDQVSGYFRTERDVLGTFNIGWRAANESNTIQIIGTGGSVSVDSYGIEKRIGAVGIIATVLNRLYLIGEIVRTQFANLGTTVDKIYLKEDETFLRAIRGKGTPFAGGKEAVQILAVLEAINTSIKTGEKVPVKRYE